MSLHPEPIGEVPAETARVSRAAFPKGTLVTRLRDEFSTLYQDDDFLGFYPARGQPPPHNAKEAHSSERGQRGSAPMRARRRDAEMVRQGPLQWPGAIPRLRPVDCSATPSYNMKWRSRADHGQKHETGDWMHFELDDQRPITEAAEPEVHLSSAATVLGASSHCLMRQGCSWPRARSLNCTRT